ncbi:polyprenyl synthetase family protein [Actinomyces vulturis]|uniref:polyprenyl synthetase family protein n=1 Tax=Actinomyces vulturis TaxID=1857645 RepID=UPI00083741D0|nr:polyprenyl synthetase family protein [Actinomyces vulturis]
MAPIPEHLSALRPLIDAELSACHQSLTSSYDHLPWVREEFIDAIGALLQGGKRMRGLLCAVGYANCSAGDDYLSALSQQAPLMMAAAIEMYQASALVHDDVMDGALTRRGLPAFHIHASTLHTEKHLAGQSDSFGSDAAILSGDLLLSRAHVLASQAITHCDSPETGMEALHAFASMTEEVAVGQYLDVRNQVEPEGDPRDMLKQALHIAVYKSARYSVTRPIMIGMALGGYRLSSVTAADDVMSCLDPLGIAFQLRDDDLGVFGNPEQTGKPAGDDIREGKRTALLALTLARLHPDQRFDVMSVVGDRAASENSVMDVRTLIEQCGARQAHEDLIESYVTQAREAIEANSVFISPVKSDLLALTDALTSRQF